jgi:hypothetical protein
MFDTVPWIPTITMSTSSYSSFHQPLTYRYIPSCSLEKVEHFMVNFSPVFTQRMASIEKTGKKEEPWLLESKRIHMSHTDDLILSQP